VGVCLVQVLSAWAGCAGSKTGDDAGGSSGSSSASGTGGAAVAELGGAAGAELGGAAGAQLGGAASQPDSQCPRSLRPGEYPSHGLCGECPGMECTGTGVTCQSEWHSSGSPWSETCQCVDGHMVCCGGSLLDASLRSCNYGSQPAPECPAALPLSGAACGEKPMFCNYPSSPCCAGSAIAGCRDGTWQVACDYAGSAPEPSPQCEGGAAGAAGAAGAHSRL
jgi:hypothetical protein